MSKYLVWVERHEEQVTRMGYLVNADSAEVM